MVWVEAGLCHAFVQTASAACRLCPSAELTHSLPQIIPYQHTITKQAFQKPACSLINISWLFSMLINRDAGKDPPLYFGTISLGNSHYVDTGNAFNLLQALNSSGNIDAFLFYLAPLGDRSGIRNNHAETLFCI